MAHKDAPHFHNNPGVPVIQIGSREFKCVGAEPPFDHPHIYLDMGHDEEIICPYCSTLYKYRSELNQTQSEPAGCYLETLA